MDKDQGMQTDIFGGVSSENAERIKKQNQQKISVVIGNPPYNANQANFNDFNKNREYPFIDKRIKETFVKNSTAQKTKVYDMYARFYRWAMDRVDKNGIITLITNRSFIDSRTFDGFRKSVKEDFDYCYIVDTFSDVRANPKIAGTTHNVFGIQTGVAMMFLVRKENRNENGCQIYYNGEIKDEWRKEIKLDWIKNQNLGSITFNNLTPSSKHNWLNITDNDWDELIPLNEKDKNSIFEKNSLGLATNRDEWVFDFEREIALKKALFFKDNYEANFEKTETVSEDNSSIKWTDDLIRFAKRKKKFNVSKKLVRHVVYRPFVKKYLLFERIIIHRPGQSEAIFGIGEKAFENTIIYLVGLNAIQQFSCLVSDNLVELAGHGSGSNVVQFSLYRYSLGGTRHDNITDWGLTQFQTHYSDPKITKEDIFHYTYGVLHNPAYRRKYGLNLKREFPRLPFYEDFHQWAAWGKELMDLHIGYEAANPYKLKQADIQPEVKGADQEKFFKEGTVDPLFGAKGKIKVKLKAKKAEGIIELDEQTSLSGIPSEAWDYKLGNRSALEWILDQYKEKKPKDKTIAEKFNTYRFADYKKRVIKLLKKVTTVSVETMKIIRQMEDANT